jgi:dihydrofolate reductase
MSKLRVHSFSVSLDGYGAGPDQSREEPLGRGGEALHEWLFPTQTFQQLQRTPKPGTTGPDDEFAAQGFENLGAWIMGRNMFGPVRVVGNDESWQGWWGKNPPYHVPVFVLTHHARPPLEMEGGTVFHFVTGGIREALERAMAEAGGRDVEIGGGWRRSASTSRRGSSTSCTWRSRHACSGPASISCTASISRPWAMSAPPMCPPPPQPTSC